MTRGGTRSIRGRLSPLRSAAALSLPAAVRTTRPPTRSARPRPTASGRHRATQGGGTTAARASSGDRKAAIGRRRWLRGSASVATRCKVIGRRLGAVPHQGRRQQHPGIRRGERRIGTRRKRRKRCTASTSPAPKGDWARPATYLSKPMAEQLEQLADKLDRTQGQGLRRHSSRPSPAPAGLGMAGNHRRSTRAACATKASRPS